MSEDQSPKQPTEPDEGVADRNVERLLAEAYRPEIPDPDFVERTTAAMQATIAATPTEPRPPRPSSLSWRIVRWTVAATLLVSVGVLLGSVWLTQPGYQREGIIVWIDGKPYKPADSGLSDAPWRRVQPQQLAQSDSSPEQLLGSAGLTARPRDEAAATPVLAVGASLSTGSGERRRVTLPDGSIAYLHQMTSVTLRQRRRLSLEQGEVFVEVQPVGAANAEDAPTENEKFVVVTPDRQITALGTKFNVRATKAGTRVFVTQGKVSVTGLDLPLLAGQQLGLPDAQHAEGLVAPAPRATHVLDWTRELMAKAESPLVPKSKYTGGALIAIDPYGQEAKLSLRKYHVDVHIEDGFARTTIDQTYFNHEPRRLEGTFYFPLPPDASLSRLAMYVNGKLMEGGMAERDRARQVFETIVHRQKDPALLEWVDGSTFKMRVFPLEGRQEKRIVLSYTQKLPSLYDRTQYRFPGGHNMQLAGEWSARIRIHGGERLQWESTSHQFDVSQDKGDLVLDASAKKIKPDRDIALTLHGSAGTGNVAPARYATCVHDGSHYLALRWRPQLPSQKQRQRRDWIFLFEASGDRDSLVARVQVDVVRTLLQNAEHDDTFSILTAGTRVRAYAAKPKRATPKNVDKAVRFLEQTQLVGALDLERALAAAGPFVAAGENPVLIHLGSGVPVLGNKEIDALAALVPETAQYVGVGVGKRWARNFMKVAAERSGGFLTQINPDEHVAWRSLELLDTLNTPRLLNVSVVDHGERFLSHSDSLAVGEELCAITRFAEGTKLPASVEVTGLLDGELYSKKIAVPDMTEQAGYLPRTWAKLEIDRLVAEGAEKNKASIIELSKAMYVMSPFTSLLVLENDAMYTQFKVDRGRKDHWAMYACPNEIPVVFEPDPNHPAVAAPEGAAKKKPTVAQVLGTVKVRIPADILYWPNRPQRYNPQMVPVLQLFNGQYGFPGANLWRRGFDGSNQWNAFGGGGGGTLHEWGMRNGLKRPTDGRAEFDDGESEKDGIWLDLDYPSMQRSSDSSHYVPLFSFGDLDLSDMRTAPPQDRPSSTTEPSVVVVRDLSPGVSAVISDVSKESGIVSVVDLSVNGRLDLTAISLDGLRVGPVAREPAGPGGVFASGDLPLLTPIDEAVTDGKKGPSEPATRNQWAVDRLRRRISHGGHHQYSYQPPQFNGNWCVFYDLLRYAPGLNTSIADLRSVIEAEAQPDPRFAPGRIDKRAGQLIRKARRAGWQKATLRDKDHKVVMTVEFDGTGRFRYEHVVGHGIGERVLCDATNLWHVYDELGLAAERVLSRFHRRMLSRLIPWVLPPAEDLARGADLIAVNKHTVAIVPRGADKTKDDDGKPAAYCRWHLVFDAAGRLSERRLVEMPSEKTIVRQTFESDGTVKLLKGDGEVVTERKIDIEPCGAPSLTPDRKRLVILPMPIRERSWLFQKYNLSQKRTHAEWTDEEAMALLAADIPANQWEANQVIAERYFNRGDRRIGFYALLLSNGHNWDRKQKQQIGRVSVHMDPLEDHPRNPLAEYVSTHLQLQRSEVPDDLKPVSGPKEGFIQKLAEFRDVWQRFDSGKANQGNDESRRRERDRALRFVRNSGSPEFGWAILSMIRNQGGDQEFYRAAGDAALAFEKIPSLSYAARYEHARGFQRSNDWKRAQTLFAKLWKDTLDDGFLPRFDHDMRSAFHHGNGSGEEWQSLVRKTATELIDKGARAAAIRLAWQVRNQGDQPLSAEIVATAVSAVPDEQRLKTALAAVEFFWQTAQYPRADTMLVPLLDDARYAKWPSLWRLAGQVAQARGMTARALRFFEQAMELEHENLPDVVNLQAIRQDYGQLLNRYQQLASAIATLEAEPPQSFLARVIRAADRWRAIDPDPTAACQTAARVFGDLGAPELAWDYLTTPLAARPNEAAPWVNMAQMLRQQGHLQLADRAYASAFEAESTNAKILWDRAHVLLEAGRTEDAERLLRQVADGEWPPQFSWIQTQAKQYVENK